MAKITAYPERVAADATAILVFSGPANVRIEWSVTGTGTIVAKSEVTDSVGMAMAIYTPGVSGETVTITAIHGT